MDTLSATDELSFALDETAFEVLAEGGVTAPPVDCLGLAERLGMAVATDGRQQARARFVRLAARGGGLNSILLRPEPRLERRQWAVAHEIGEWVAHRVFDRLALDPREASPAYREQVANLMASRLLLPTDWYATDAERCGWDLWALKERYRTASHELLARRMLDFSAPIVITVFDQGRLTWRRSNVPGRPPALAEWERACWEQVAATVAVHQAVRQFSRAVCWPVHEAGWRREILRTEAHELADG